MDLQDLRNAFTEMLVLSQKRGSSATGVIHSFYDRKEKKNKITVIRAPLRSEEFVKSKEYHTLIENLNDDTHFIIGHTRAPTGTAPPNLNRNNHPHRAGRIIGVHNGHISNHHDLWKDLKDVPKSACDSEVIFAMIEKNRTEGLKTLDATTNTMLDLIGWYAIAFADTETPTTLYLARDETELEFAWHEAQRVAFVASEKEFIHKAIKKSKLPGTAEDRIFEKNTVVGIDSFVDGDPKSLWITKESINPNNEVEWNEENLALLAKTRGK